MITRPSLTRAIIAAGLAFITLQSAAQAATFSVNPTRMELSTSHRTDIINFTNNGEAPLRLQARTMLWHMQADGHWQLTPSDDLIVTPELLEVAPGGVAQLRIGSLIAGTASEGSYRILLNELPNLDDTDSTHKQQIRVLTEISLPVFLEPVGVTRIPDIRSASIALDVLTIAVGNDGSQRLDPQGIVVSVMDRAGKTLSRRTMMSNYVLAGAMWPLNITLPADACARATSVSVSWSAISDIPITRAITTQGAGACASTAAR